MGHRRRRDRVTTPKPDTYRPYTYATDSIRQVQQQLWLIGLVSGIGVILSGVIAVLWPPGIPFLIIGWVVGAMVIGWIIRSKRRDLRLWQVGLHAEQEAATVLNQIVTRLAHHGTPYQIWHDIPLAGVGNIDHLLIPSTGSVIVMVETKAWRRFNEQRRMDVSRQLSNQWHALRRVYPDTTIVAVCYLPHADLVYPFDPDQGMVAYEGMRTMDWFLSTLPQWWRYQQRFGSASFQPDQIIRKLRMKG